MERREIPRDSWVDFFDGFSRQHEGWLAKLEVSQDGKSAWTELQTEAHDLPLEGVGADLKHGDDDTITITLEKGDDESLTHMLTAARRVWLLKTDQGADAGLEIQAVDGSQARLLFRTPALPETVDGVTGTVRRNE